jgi:hypothetical protein
MMMPCPCPSLLYAIEIKHKKSLFGYLRQELDTVEGFLIKLGIKPCLHILEISIFSLNHVIISPTQIMNNSLKDCKFVLSKSFFCIENQPNLSDFFFFEDYLTKRSTFINEMF